MVKLQNRRWVAAVGIAFAVVVAVGLAGYQWYEPGWRYSIRGVDVSHHQGPIDWVALAADGTAFAYIKATEGGDFSDSRFAENWEAAHVAGVLRGAYHFFTLCTPGADQAAHLIATVPDEPGMLPPAVDLEFGGNCAARPSVDEFTIELQTFLDAIEHHYRMRPVIYTNAHFYDRYLDERQWDVTWWIQSPVLEPWGSPEWTFWQHFPGNRAGVSGRVDRNAFNGDEADLHGLTDQSA
jgi:lysozyme